MSLIAIVTASVIVNESAIAIETGGSQVDAATPCAVQLTVSGGSSAVGGRVGWVVALQRLHRNALARRYARSREGVSWG